VDAPVSSLPSPFSVVTAFILAVAFIVAIVTSGTALLWNISERVTPLERLDGDGITDKDWKGGDELHDFG
jgi:hypothetical protein